MACSHGAPVYSASQIPLQLNPSTSVLHWYTTLQLYSSSSAHSSMGFVCCQELCNMVCRQSRSFLLRKVPHTLEHDCFAALDVRTELSGIGRGHSPVQVSPQDQGWDPDPCDAGRVIQRLRLSKCLPQCFPVACSPRNIIATIHLRFQGELIAWL